MRAILLTMCAGLLVSCGKPSVTPAPDLSSINWGLVETESHLSFVTIKKGEVAEVHSFEALAGSVDKDGNAAVQIILDSVQTNIDIRNTRMREHLFQTDLHPFATIKTSLNMSDLRQMDIGTRSNMDIELDVNLHGIGSVIEAEVLVTRISGDKVLVETSVPILVHADEFDLVEGVDMLRELAKLPSITPIVPINFSLVFEVKS